MDSLYAPGASYPMTVKISENFNDKSALSDKLAFSGALGANLVNGKYQTAWTDALEMFLKEGYENVKYEFKITADTTLHSGFALRVEPGKSTNMFGGGRSTNENEAAFGISFDLINAKYPGSIAIGFNSGPTNASPIVAVTYPSGFNPKVENTFVVYDYGNVITVNINGAKFCHLVFEKSAAATYDKCYVFKPDHTLVGGATGCGTFKSGGFTVASRTGYVMIDDLTVSTFGGMYSILDLEPLQDALATAKSKTNIGYVTSTWKRLQAAITKAETVLAKGESNITVAEAESATGDLLYALGRLLVKVAHGDLTGKLELTKTNEQFIEVIASSVMTDSFLDFKHSGTKGNGGFILKFDAESKGTKTVTISYDCAHPAEAYPILHIYVYENGAAEPTIYELPSNGNGAWGRFQEFEFTVNAKKGENEIYIASASEPQGLNAHIDYLLIGALVPAVETSPETGDVNGIFMMIACVSMIASALYIVRRRMILN